MNNVLKLSSLFPPQTSISGSQPFIHHGSPLNKFYGHRPWPRTPQDLDLNHSISSSFHGPRDDIMTPQGFADQD